MTSLRFIEDRIAGALPGSAVEVLDLTGGGDHLRAVVRASQFAGLTPLAQHRLVYAAVQDLLDDGTIHALSISTEPTSEDAA